MYELIQVADRCFYIQCPAKIGVVLTGDGEVCLIDSGNDKDAGKKVKKHLDAKGWKLKAIYNTHSHADHIGGNKYLQAQTGCNVFAPGIERDFTEHPVLEPSYLYGGNPPKELKHKFLMAQECEVKPLSADCLPDGWSVVPLPGHSFDMTGFRVPGDVVFLADCLSSRETLEKYQVSFLTDVERSLETLEKVKSMQAEMFIPSHADAASEIAPLAQANIDKMLEIAGKITDFCREPLCFEQILKKVFEEYNLLMTFEQHALIGSTVRSYLSWLSETGRLRMKIEENLLLWERA
ncbi:MAG: MBL fold metallo-hydrolase [Parasporobacterium sp.]|nr:MBL fold metallo-hydrolase [Parasporobacterium sp.]